MLTKFDLENPVFCRRMGTIIAIAAIMLFLVLSLVRPYPSGSSLKDVLVNHGDDWYTYANNAMIIKHEGIFMPSLKTPYYGPSGFLYSYFIALCLTLFGEKLLPVLVVQHVMLGISIALFYWTFRDKMKGLTGLAFLCTMIAFGFLDVYKYYSPRLLSENLSLFLTALFFFCFVKGFEKNVFKLQLASAACLGVSILVRPNIALYGVVLLSILIYNYFKQGGSGIIRAVLFISVFAISVSFLGVRNYIICKSWIFLPTLFSFNYLISFNPIPSSVDLSRVETNFMYAKLHFKKEIVMFIEYLLQRPALFIGHYADRILFCFGFLPVLAPAYHTRPHWIVMWLGYFYYLILLFKNRQKIPLWELSVHLFILLYYIPLLNTNVQNYGFRMLIPVTNLVLMFAFIALDRIKYPHKALEGRKELV